MRLRQKADTAAPTIDEPVLCVSGFRYGAIGREIQRGQYLRADHPAVVAFPQHFRVLVPLSELKEDK